MASKHLVLPLRQASIQSSRNATPHHQARSMATHASRPKDTSKAQRIRSLIKPYDLPSHLAPPPVLTTLYSFPTLEPLEFLSYPATHLNVPLRKDILHRAVVFEGDATRQGTASTKWRSEVHGSNRKIRPQKGTGKARLGNKKSPMLTGGGVAFGPHPRDFSTGLNQKIYDLAVRTALSYRWRQGELVVVDALGVPVDIDTKDEGYWIRSCFDTLGWGNGKGRSMVVTMGTDEGAENSLARALNASRDHGRAQSVDQVDVKNLLEMGRVVIEQRALDYILGKHQSDLRWPKKARGELSSSGLTTGVSPGEVEELGVEMEASDEFIEEDGIDLAIAEGASEETSMRLEK